MVLGNARNTIIQLIGHINAEEGEKEKQRTWSKDWENPCLVQSLMKELSQGMPGTAMRAE